MQTISTFAEKLATILIKKRLSPLMGDSIAASTRVNYKQSDNWHLSSCIR